MTSILKLASALCFCLFSLVCNAQTTSGNLIDNGQWQGATYGADPGGCCASISGSGPLYDNTTGTIMFSYGQSTISQTIGLNQALGGTGISVNGYNYSWDYRLISNNGRTGDTLTATISLKDSQGNVAQTQNFNYSGAAHDIWNTESGTTTFTNSYADPLSVTLSFTGRDGGFWAGYYGPELRNINLSVNYGSDPCAVDPLYSTTCSGYAEAYKNLQCQSNPLYDVTCLGYAQAFHDQQCSMNPLYATDCAGYSSVITSDNLVPKTGSWYREVNQSFAINTALGHNGAGVMVHGFQWGLQTFGFGGSFISDVNIRDSQGGSLYSFSTGWQSAGIGYTDRNYSYIFPESKNNLSLGTFDYTAQVDGLAAVGNFWARAMYSPDSCSLDPLSSPLCSKYQEAFLDQQCAIYTMYSPSCPGYAEALQEMLAQSMAYGVTDSAVATGVDTGVDTGSTTGAQTATADPVPTAEVTTDIGGAELSTTGEVVISTGAPEVKETVKEKTTEEKQAAESSAPTGSESSDKKKTKVNALAIAQNAVREAEATALSVTDAAVAASLSEAANPGDGINLELGTGLLLSGSQTPFGLGSNELQMALISSDVLNQAARSRQNSVDNESTENSIAESNKSETRIVDITTATVGPTIEEKTETGPSVRRGGVVEGMEGGADMNALSKPPADFNSYLAAQMQDGQFYASREIYKGQVNVDNRRAMRALGSDRLHQQMVDQQWDLAK